MPRSFAHEVDEVITRLEDVASERMARTASDMRDQIVRQRRAIFAATSRLRRVGRQGDDLQSRYKALPLLLQGTTTNALMAWAPPIGRTPGASAHALARRIAKDHGLILSRSSFRGREEFQLGFRKMLR